ncbi:unnamed protein product [Caretta caretta]
MKLKPFISEHTSKKDKLGAPSHRGNCQKNSPEFTAWTLQVVSKIDCDLLTLSNGGIASNLSKDLARNDSFPLSVIGDSTNTFGSKEGYSKNNLMT